MNQIYIRGNEIATKAYVDSLSLGGSSSALDNYYTKEEIDGYGLYVLKDLKICSSSFSGGSSYLNWVDTDENKCAQISAIFNQAVFNHDFRPVLVMSDRNDPSEYATSFSGIIHPAFSRSDLRSKRTSYWYKGIDHNRSGYSYTSFNDFILLESVGLEVIGEWQEDESFKCTSYAFLLSSQTLAQSEWTNYNFLRKNNTTSYTPTADYNPATKLYVDTAVYDAIKEQPTTQELIDEGFDYFLGNQTIHCNYTVTNLSDTYQFILNENGYYESNNKGASNSYALCRVDFNNDIDIDLTIDYISFGESNYDFGIFSKLDLSLTRNSSEDNANVVEKSCKGEASTDVKQIIYHIPAGEHFIEIKYRKDSGGDRDNDSLQFKIEEDQIIPMYENQQLATKEYIDELLSNMEPGNNNQSSSDLSNYYTKDEIDKAITDAIADVKTTDFQVSNALPTENISSNTIYLITKEGEDGDIYEEYIYVNNKWEKIGETTVDLSKYSTTEEMNAAIAAEIAKISGGNESSTCDKVYSFDDTDLGKPETYAAFTEIINNYINSGYKTNSIVIVNQNGTEGSAQEDPPILFYRLHKINDTIYGIEGNSFKGQYYVRGYLPEIKYELMYITLTNGVVTKIQRQAGETYPILSTTNKVAYTPKDNYNPATKKYVDDIVGDINSILDAINGEEV